MLAKAPLKLHESLRCFQKESLLYSSEQRRCRKSRPCSVRAGYTRKPTGTPGAYQLIDDVTGEKFFVWGGSDDTPDSPTPSKQALSWNPGTPPSAQQAVKKKSDRDVTGMGGAKLTTSVANGRNSTARKGIFAASFGRLKAQHVRALIKKASGKRQENTNDGRAFDGEDMFSDPSDGSDSEVEFVATEYGHEEGFLTADQSQITEDNVLGNEMIPDTDHSNVDPKYDCKQASEDKITKAKAHESDSGVAKPKVGAPRSASSLRGWSNSSLHQRTMVDLAYPTKQWKKTSATTGFFSRSSFKDLGCSEDMIESLRAQLFTRPSHIQAMAYVPVSKGKSCIIADQSGSGKTLAYLAPVIQCLRQEELQGVSKSSPRSPRVVILVPTAELASQVLNNCRSISKFGVPFRSMVATGGFRQKTQVDNLQQDLDVLIATPGRFIFLLQEGLLQLTNLKCAVLDEIDILFGDEGFEQVLQSLISSAPVATQYLFVTATLPVDIYNKLVEVFPDCEVVMGPGMHRTSSGLEELLVDCSGDDGEEKTPDTAFLNKKSALLQIVEETPVLKTIVFCNKIETCRKVENVLKRFDRKGLHIRVLPFHAAVAQESRLANMKEFISSQTKDCMFLICTDRASRGIDFANVDHVVLFDFPRDPSEYVRRVGRTARGAGGKGKAFAFVVGKQVSLARRIMERNLRGHPLHDVPAAYEVMSSAL